MLTIALRTWFSWVDKQASANSHKVSINNQAEPFCTGLFLKYQCQSFEPLLVYTLRSSIAESTMRTWPIDFSHL